MKGKLALTAVAFFGLVMLSSAGGTAKKLVGVWEATKEDGKEPKGQKTVFEFTADGKFSGPDTSADPDRPTNKGEYRVEGDVIKMYYPLRNSYHSYDEWKVRKLTDTGLQLRVWDAGPKAPKDDGYFEFKRVKK